MAVNGGSGDGSPATASGSADDRKKPRDSAKVAPPISRTSAPRTFAATGTPGRNKRTLLIAAAGIIVLVVVAGGYFIATSGNTSTFRDPKTGISLSYPASWSVVQVSDPTVILQLNFGRSTTIDALQVRVNQTEALVGSSSANVAAVRAVTDAIVSGTPAIVQPGFPKALTINGMPGYVYLYTFDDPVSKQPRVHRHYFLFQGHNMISLVFEAAKADYARLAATFDQVAASLHSSAPVVIPTTPSTS